MKSKFAFFIDNIFCIFTTFLISFVWIRYFVHNKFLIFVLCFVITLVINFFLLIFFDKKRKNTFLKNKERKDFENAFNHFLFIDNVSLIKEIFLILKEFNPVIENDNLYINFLSQKTLFIPIISLNKITEQDYVEIIKKHKNENSIFVLAKEEENSAFSFRKSLNYNISFIPLLNFYKKFMSNTLFNENHFKQKQKTKKEEILKIIFNKNQSKKYFILFLFFAFYSFIFRYNIYYLICSFILGAISIYCKKNKRFNFLENDNIFA